MSEPEFEEVNAEEVSKADEPSIDKSPAHEVSEELSFDEWAQAEIIDFLDIADLPTSNERHNAIVALKLGEKLPKKFKLIEAFLSLRGAYISTLGDDSFEKEKNNAVHAKVAILKKQIGI